MSSSTILESYFSVVLASVSAFCLLFLRHRIPIHGGKLGMIAFISVLLVNLPEVIEGEIEIISGDLFLTGEMVAILVTFSMLSLYLTYYLRTVLQKRFSHDSVIASAIIGIIFGFFSILVPETLMIGEVAYASSFAGMGRIKIIKEKFLLVSVIVAAIYILALPVFKGFGGKLGSIAFVSMLLVYILHGKGELFE